MVEHALKRGWPTCDPRVKYMQPSVTSIVPVTQRNKHNISTEHNMKNVLARNVFTNYRVARGPKLLSIKIMLLR